MRYRAAALLCLAVLTSRMPADTVIKHDGGRIEGEVLDRESTADTVVMKTKFGSLKIPRAQVATIERSDSVLDEYEKRSAAVGDTADDHFALGEWCLEKKLNEQAQTQFERAIKLNPDHAEARKRLGYEQRDGKWLTEDEVKARDGYVKYRGKWMLPQERVQAEERRADEEKRRELGQMIRVAQRGLRAGETNRQEQSRRDLLAIKEPVAVPLLMANLGKKGTDPERRLLVDVLEGIDGPESTQAIMTLIFVDKDQSVASAAISAIKPRKSPTMLQQAAKELRNNNNDRVRRSGSLLAEIGDSSVVPALIDALITTHRTVIEPTFKDFVDSMGSHKVRTSETVILPDGTIIRRNLLRGQSANSVLTPPEPRRRVIVEEKKNREVLEALKTLTGQDFGFDALAWRSWLKNEYQDDAARQ